MKEKLIFLHIPKSAGSTLQVIFKRQYKRDAYFVNGKYPDLKVIEEALNSKNIEMCFGHMDFGMHEVIGKSYKYATILRDPIERVISQYYYVKRKPKHHLYHQAFEENNYTLAEYVASGLSRELNNGQVRILTGAGGFHKNNHTKHKIPFGKCESWMLEEAKSNVEKHFVFCGLQEYFDESLVLLKKDLEWNWDIGYVSRNITQQRTKVSQLDNETLKVIRNLNALDIELYDWAKTNFLKRIENQHLYIEKALRKLKWANQLENYRDQIKNSLRKIFKTST